MGEIMAARSGSRRITRTIGRPTPIVIPPWGRVGLTVGILLALLLFFVAAPSTVVILIGGFMFALILSFPVDGLSRFMPRGLAIGSTILIVLLMIVVSLFILIPLLLAQLTELVRAIPGFAITSSERVRSWLEVLESRGLLPADTDTVITRAQLALFARGQQLAEYVLGELAGALFSTFFSTLILTSTTLVTGLYLIADVRRMKASFLRLAPRRYRRDAAAFWTAMAETFRRWLGAGLLSIIFEAVAATVGFWLLGLPFAPLIGLWMGLTAIIPYVGAWLGAIPAVFLGLVDSPLKAAMVAGLCLLINVVDGNLLVPRLQGKAVGAPPVLVIVAVIGGGQIFGVLGAFMAVPTLAFLKVVIDFLRARIEVRGSGIVATPTGLRPPLRYPRPRR